MKSIKSVHKNGTIRYKNERGVHHREDGPAYETKEGYKGWYINGVVHREDGPAVVYSDGDVDYYLNNKRYSKEEWEIERLKWLDHRGFPMSANKVYLYRLRSGI